MSARFHHSYTLTNANRVGNYTPPTGVTYSLRPTKGPLTRSSTKMPNRRSISPQSLERAQQAFESLRFHQLPLSSKNVRRSRRPVNRNSINANAAMKLSRSRAEQMKFNAFNARVKDALTNARNIAKKMGIQVTNAELMAIALSSIKKSERNVLSKLNSPT